MVAPYLGRSRSSCTSSTDNTISKNTPLGLGITMEFGVGWYVLFALIMLCMSYWRVREDIQG